MDQTEAQVQSEETGNERRVLVADAWYGMPHPWYSLQRSAPSPPGGQPLPHPSRVIFEYDAPKAEPADGPTPESELPADGYPSFDREVSYQVKFFATHGYWPDDQQSGLPDFSTSEMQIIRTLATMIVTQPQAQVSVVTRDRLEAKGLLN